MKRLRTWQYIAGSLALLLVVTPLPAQEPESRPNTIGTQPRGLGGFVELDMRFGDMMGEFAAFAGARAAVLLKQRVYLGVGGAGLATDNALIEIPSHPSANPLRMGYGGFVIGYVIPTSSLVRVTTDVLVGAGQVHPSGIDEEDGIFVFEPAAGLELRLAPIARLVIGAGYRFVGDVDLPGVEDSDLRGLTGTASIRVGRF